jgi:RNA polymerase sigma-70 factor (ECF subfamily)
MGINTVLFLKYYNKYKDKIFNYFFYRTGYNRELSEDFVSEIFEKALNHFESFEDDKEFGPWIYRIAHNHLVDYYRKNKQDFSIDSLLEDNQNLEKDLNLSYEESVTIEIDRQILSEDIKKILNKLPEVDKELITLRYLSDLDYKEISKILNKQEGTIRTALSRSLQKLKVLLKNFENENK